MLRIQSLLTLTLLALPCAAQEPKSMTMLAFYKVKYGKMGEFTAATEKSIFPALDKLLADGNILAYGMDADILHVSGQPNVVGWFTVSNYANLQKATDAVGSALGSHRVEAQTLITDSDMEAHQDLLLETISGKHGKVPAGAKPFTSVSYVKVNHGKGSDWEKNGNQYFKPVYDRLVDEGVLYGYDVMQQALHSQDSGGRWIVLSLPDLAAMDKADAAFEEAMKRRSAAEKSIMQGVTRDATDGSAHRDYLLGAITFKSR